MDALRLAQRKELPGRIVQDLKSRGWDARLDPIRHEILATDVRGFESRLIFGDDGLPAAVVQPSGMRKDLEFDPQGRLIGIGLPNGEKIQFPRDAGGRIVGVQSAGAAAGYLFERLPDGRVRSVTYPDGLWISFKFDDLGRPTAYVDRSGATTHYHRTDREYRVEDPLGRSVVVRSDEAGRLERIVHADGREEAFGFDEKQGLAVVQLRDGRAMVQMQSADGGSTDVWLPDGEAYRLEFDGDGNLSAAENAAGRVERTVDENGLAVEERTPDGIVASEMDADGRVTSVATPFGDATAYEYDGDGRLASIVDWEGRRTEFTYAPDGSEIRIEYPNGMVEERRYDGLGPLSSSLLYDAQRRPISEQRCQYDALERIIAYDDRCQPAGYAMSRRLVYDAEHRLLREESSDGRELASYEYDAKGNMRKIRGREVAVGDLDEVRSIDGRPIAYDELGRAVEIPFNSGSLELRYSASGLLQEVVGSHGAVHYEYDALRRRIAKRFGAQTWRFGWNDRQLLWESYQEDPSATPIRRDYLFYPNSVVPFAFREGGETYWLQADARGAVVRAFDRAGRIVWCGTYDGFGRVQVVVDQVRQPLRLLGQYSDPESGLSYNHVRYYSPTLRTYLTRDPKWLEFGTSNYAYCRNDPWNHADPFGEMPLPIVAVAAIGAGVGSLVGAAVAAYMAPEGKKWSAAAGGAVAGAVAGGGGVFAGAAVAAGTLSAAAAGAIGLASTFVGEFLGEMTDRVVAGENPCVECAWRAALSALAFDAALLGFGKVVPTSAKQSMRRFALTKPGPLSKWMRKRVLSKKIRDLRLTSIAKQDYSTEPGRAVFYSGKNARKKAEAFAKKNGSATLEHTQFGRELDRQNLYGQGSSMSKADADEVWRAASKKYAEGASGPVNAVVENPGIGRILGDVELPALLRNDKAPAVKLQGTVSREFYDAVISNPRKYPNASKIDWSQVRVVE